MRSIYNFTVLLFLSIIFCSFSKVTDQDILSQGLTDEQLYDLQQDHITGQTGTIDLPECHASLNVPQGFVFLDKEQAKKLLIDYWNNPKDRADSLLGVLVPNDAECFYQIAVAYAITYDNTGYVKDDDANSIDYSELLEQIKEACNTENKSLPEEQRMELVNWAVTPRYVSSEHVLVWAKLFRMTADGNQVINYDMRILGKSGLVSINAVIGQEDLQEVQEKERDMIGSVVFDDGFKYEDFDSSKDKVSDWTIGGLVAGSILAKSGIFAKLGVFLLKFWKLIVVGAVAGLAGIRKLFKKDRGEE